MFASKSTVSKPKAKPKSNDPFGSDSDDDDDELFSNKPTKGEVSKQIPKKNDPFGSDNDDDDDILSANKKQNEAPKGEEVKKGKNKFKIDVNALRPGAHRAIKKKVGFKSASDGVIITESNEVPEPKKKVKSADPFGSDSDDDMFADKPKGNVAPVKASKSTVFDRFCYTYIQSMIC